MATAAAYFRYVSVEFAGYPITPENELNGIAFQAVGSGTTLEYLHVHKAADDGIEFFGGAANFKYVLTTAISDDNLDWTDGWVGKGQFFVAQQHPGAGDNGIEADNNGDANNSSPRSKPTLSNLTFIGSGDADNSDIGLLLREGTGANLSNVVALNWKEACLDVDHQATYENAWDEGAGDLSGELTMTNSIVDCDVNFGPHNEDDTGDPPTYTPPFTVEEFYTQQDGNTEQDPMLVRPNSLTNPDYRPDTGSPAATGGSVPTDSFFDDVSFRGGVDPSDNWTRGWTRFPQT